MGICYLNAKIFPTDDLKNGHKTRRQQINDLKGGLTLKVDMSNRPHATGRFLLAFAS